MEPPSTGSVTVLNATERKVDVALVRRAASVALLQHGFVGAIVCVMLTDDTEVRRLNQQFRGLDEPTDVLSFPADASMLPPGSGDIAISVEYADGQAHARGVPLDHELGYLAIHGALHLAGFDDEADEDRAEMFCAMNAAAIEGGLPSDPEWMSILHEEVA